MAFLYLHHASCTVNISTCRVIISDMVRIKVMGIRVGLGLG